MEFLFWFIFGAIFVFGLMVGSFLNCWIWRFHRGQSPLQGRSYCPNCLHSLAWFDLAPVFSYLFLRGKCRYCKKPISWQYPAVELSAAVLFVAAALAFYPSLFSGGWSFYLFFQLAAYWLLISAFIVIFVADLRWYLIPDSALAVGLIGVLCLRAAQFWESYSVFGEIAVGDIFALFIPSLFAGLLFLALFLVSRGKWMGFGDVKLAFLMGLSLDFVPTLIALFLANFFGAIIGLSLIAAGKKKMSSQIPFGPFLVGGTLIALFFESSIANWYF
jgi:leader peptidase (prepilin peptidase)/N-methyltransferase